MKKTQQTIQTADNYSLTATVYEPQAKPKGVILIASAMGVKQSYYQSFANWLTDNGFAAVTFDYRGVGESRHGKLKDVKADIIDWAEKDCGAVIRYISDTFNDLTVYWIGHSLGGQLFPFVPGTDAVSKMITVATGSGYWKENAPSLKRTVWWLWYVIAPVSVRIFGYFPGRTLKKVGDLPAGVMMQWRNWCLNKDYAPGYEGESVRTKYSQVDVPITSLSFSDDQYMSKRNIESLHGFYTGSNVQMKRINPKDVDTGYIGHFGFFKEKFREKLWNTQVLPELVGENGGS